MTNNPNYYAILTSDVRYSPVLSAQEKLLFAEITALTSKDGVCFAGNKYFADLYGLSTVTISRQISALEKEGFIKIDYEKNGAKVKKRIITINKNVNGKAQTLNKNVNRTINKNVKENNTSILTLQDNNNISQDAKDCVALFIEGLKKTNPKVDRSEKQKIKYGETFDILFGAYSVDEVKRMIKFATTDSFWKKICLSAEKINMHAEKLYVNSLSPSNQLDCDRVENTEVNF